MCFAHILLDGTETNFDIPPAIGDRMLFDGIFCTYTYFPIHKVGGEGTLTQTTGFADIYFDEIVCSDAGIGYLFCYFPIDSNK